MIPQFLIRLQKIIQRNRTLSWLLASLSAYLIINAILRLWILSGFLSYLPDRIFNPVYAFGLHLLPGVFGEIPSVCLVFLLLAIPGLLGARKISLLLLAVAISLTIAGLHYFMYAVDWFTPQDLRLTGGATLESSIALISGSFSIPVIIIELCLGIAGLYILQALFFRWLTKAQHPFCRRALYSIASMLILAILYRVLPAPWYHKCAHNPLVYFVGKFIEAEGTTAPPTLAEVQAAAREAGFPDCLYPADGLRSDSADPLLRTMAAVPVDKPAGRNIFLFVLESLSRQILAHNALSEKFQNLRQQLVAFPSFYANGFPTTAGHESLLYSLFPPVLDGYNFRQHRMLSLAQICAKNGYATQAYLCSQHESAKQYRFFENAGFGTIYDTQFFNIPEKGERAAETVLLSAMVSNVSAWTNSKPLLVFFSSAIGHSPFRYYPGKSPVQKLLQNASTLEERYLNQIHFILDSVSTAIDAIRETKVGRNAIFIITGDHGPHAALAYEKIGLPRIAPDKEFAERHRIPFILYSPTFSNPLSVVTQRIGGQIDIAPTILELAGVPEGTTRFLGQSLFGERWKDERMLLLNRKHAVFGKCLINEDTGQLAGEVPSPDKAAGLHDKAQKLRKFMLLYRAYFQQTLSLSDTKSQD